MLLFLVASLLVPLAAASGEGNLHLMEEEIAQALRNCASKPAHSAGVRTRRDVTGNHHNNYGLRNNKSGQNNDNNEDSTAKQNATPNDSTSYGPNATSARVDNATQTDNPYGHERRNAGNTRINALNSSQPLARDSDSDQRWTDSSTGSARTKRGGGGLFADPDSDQCLSQCVFANLQVVDTRGIPREPELWAKVQTSVTSQQSRNALKDQIHACFQELEQEAEDDGCSYSNKLERCLTLRLVERSMQNATSRAPSNHSN